MLVSLKLKNFRKHEDKEFFFTPGLNIIRGENEGGKTTINEAIGYAKFGSSALRESLEDVVTYDKPLNSLKVELVERIDGVEYRTVRGKSGAEITYTDPLGKDQRVTGQDATKAFFENMLGCAAKTFGMLALASQGDVRGVLKDGPTATNGLVETLAQLDIVETIIDKVQNQLPSGNTGALSKQIEAIEIGSEPVKPEFENDSAIVAKITEITLCRSSAEARLPDANKLAIAEVALKTASNLSRDRLKQVERNAKLAEGLKEPVKPAVTEEDLAKARETVANAAEEERRRKAYKTGFKTCQQIWDDSLDSLKAEIVKVETEWQTSKDSASKIAASIAQAKKSIVTGTSCPTCKQELPNAAAVLEHNKQHESDIAIWEHELAYAKTFTEDKKTELQALKFILEVHNENLLKLGNYFTMDESRGIPGEPVWIGEVPGPETPLPNVAAMEKELKDYDKALLIYQQAQATLAEPLPEVPDVTEETLLMATAEATRKELVQLKEALAEQQALKVKVDSANALKQVCYERDVQEYQKAGEQKKSLQKDLAEMTTNNALIKKLRAARPVIATELWGIVLGAVSHYTTAIRGEASLITKDAEGFKIGGRMVSGLSGSGQDALGLSVRIALCKTFLPNLPFIMLDEPFAACDDNREVNGLGTLAAAGFSQVLLVTHSDLGDSLADNLIQL